MTSKGKNWMSSYAVEAGPRLSGSDEPSGAKEPELDSRLRGNDAVVAVGVR